MSAAGIHFGRRLRSRWREWWEWARPGLEDFTKLLTAVSIIGTGVRFFAEADDRTRDLLYKEWEEVRSPQTQGRNGARDHALTDLARRGVSLENVDLRYAWMDWIDLRGALLNDAELTGVQLKWADLGCRGDRCTQLSFARLRGATLTGARLEGADLSNANLNWTVLLNACLRGTSLREAHLVGANLKRANLAGADLRGADLDSLPTGWQNIASLLDANISGVKNAPPGFVAWARDSMGAVDDPADSTWQPARPHGASCPRLQREGLGRSGYDGGA